MKIKIVKCTPPHTYEPSEQEYIVIEETKLEYLVHDATAFGMYVGKYDCEIINEKENKKEN